MKREREKEREREEEEEEKEERNKGKIFLPSFRPSVQLIQNKRKELLVSAWIKDHGSHHPSRLDVSWIINASFISESARGQVRERRKVL